MGTIWEPDPHLVYGDFMAPILPYCCVWRTLTALTFLTGVSITYRYGLGVRAGHELFKLAIL